MANWFHLSEFFKPNNYLGAIAFPRMLILLRQVCYSSTGGECYCRQHHPDYSSELQCCGVSIKWDHKQETEMHPRQRDARPVIVFRLVLKVVMVTAAMKLLLATEFLILKTHNLQLKFHFKHPNKLRYPYFRFEVVWSRDFPNSAHVEEHCVTLPCIQLSIFQKLEAAFIDVVVLECTLSTGLRCFQFLWFLFLDFRYPVRPNS